jgi:hypothetical protein
MRKCQGRCFHGGAIDVIAISGACDRACRWVLAGRRESPLHVGYAPCWFRRIIFSSPGIFRGCHVEARFYIPRFSDQERLCEQLWIAVDVSFTGHVHFMWKGRMNVCQRIVGSTNDKHAMV